MLKHRHIWLVYPVAVLVGTLIYFLPSLLNESSSYEGTKLTGDAPDFQLVDQHGSMISLSDFRGQVVVLTFMDSQCKDTCPVTAAHFRQAYRQLNSIESGHVVFMGVNVNLDANQIADVNEITQTWHLDEIPNWHFLTGNPAELESVWRDYDIAVEPSLGSQEEILHTPGIYIIDPLGQKRWYVSTPFSADDNAEFDLPLSKLLVSHIREILGEN